MSGDLPPDVVTLCFQVGEVSEFAVLDLRTVIPVLDVVSRSAAVVEVLVLVNAGVVVVGETGPCNTGTVVETGHVVEDNISNDLDASSVTSVHHVLVLIPATALRLEDVAGDLVIGPPLTTLNVLIDGIHLDVTVSSWTDEVFAFVGD